MHTVHLEKQVYFFFKLRNKTLNNERFWESLNIETLAEALAGYKEQMWQ